MSRSRFLVFCSLLWVALLLACGDGGAASGDDGAADTFGDSLGDGLGDSSQALFLPDPPLLTPCPPGWTEMPGAVAEEPTTCEPVAGANGAICPAGRVRFPGDGECHPLGVCPSGDWADDLSDDVPVRFVRSGAAPGGDGSSGAPFATIADALAGAPAGAVIALARGTLAEMVSLPEGVTLWGACSGETRLRAPGGSAAALIVAGPDILVRGLTIEDGPIGIDVASNAGVDLRDVVVLEARGLGIRVGSGGRVTGGPIAIHGTRPPALDGGLGVGLQVEPEAVVDLERLAVSVTWGIGIQATGAQLSLRDSVVVDTRLEVGPWAIPAGAGLIASAAEVTVARALFECNAFTSIVGLGEGTILRIDDAVLRGAPPDGACPSTVGILPGPQDSDENPTAQEGQIPFSWGMVVADGGRAETSRIVFDGNHPIGVALLSFGHLGITDGVIRRTFADFPERTLAIGLLAYRLGPAPAEEPGAEPAMEVSLERVAILGVEGAAAFADGDVRLSGTHVTIRDTREVPCERECPTDPFGTGLVASRGALIDLTRFDVVGSPLVGLQIVDEGEIDLHQGRVTRNRIAVNLQTGAFDVTRLQRDVAYVDNGRNLDTEQIPIPDPLEALGL